MDETHLVNQVKEDACYVSSSFAADLEETWKGGQRDGKQVDTSIVVDYVLPDYDNVKRGFMRPHDPAQSRLRRTGPVHGPREDVLPLGNERFSVPELLFEPRDVGLREAGLPELVMQCLEALPVGLRPAMLANVVVVGGNALIKGFVERLEREIRTRAPAEWIVRVVSQSRRLDGFCSFVLRSLLVLEHFLRASSVLLSRYARTSETFVRL